MNRVILVDDEQFVRKGLMTLIDWEECGFEVSGEASNGEDAFKLINDKNPDLVITDIKMPVVDGLELIKSLVQINKTKPKFIVISGYNDFKYAQTALRYGVTDFILKPINKEELETTLLKLAETLQTEKVEAQIRNQELVVKMYEDLIEGRINKDEILRYVDKLGISTCKKYYYLLIELNGAHKRPSLDIDTFKKEVIDIVQYETSTVFPIHLHEHNKGVYGLIITNQELKFYRDNIKQFVNKLNGELSRKMTDSTLYVGKAIDSLSRLKESYDSAVHAMQYKYIQNDNSPIFYDTIKDTEIHFTELDHKLYSMLMENIEECNPIAIKDSIESIISEFQTKKFAPEAVKTSINRCIHGVIKRIKNLNGEETELSGLVEMIEWEHYYFTTIDLKKRLTEFMLEGSEYLLILRKETAKGDIYKVKYYIETHFQENISIKSIAATFYMNPVYMGQLFKKTYGIYFKEYLLDLRLTEAKKLLRQTNMRIYEVAEKVGFGSTDYFVTQFEKIEGVTPTEYRNQILKS